MHNVVKNEIVFVYPYSEALCKPTKPNWTDIHINAQCGQNKIVLVYPSSEALWGGVGALRLFSWMAYLIISKLNFTENQAVHHPAIKTFHETKKEKGFADRPFQNSGIAKTRGEVFDLF